MSTVGRPRGPLPARVYWMRRLVVLGLTVMLVVGIQRLLSYDGVDDEPAVAASTVGAPFELPTLTVMPSPSDGMVIKPQRRKVALPEPDGPCDPQDLLVTPVVEAAHVARPVQVILELTTTRSEACEFEVSGETVAVNITMLTGARELLWSTQDCPDALAETTVVARRDVPGRAVAEWSGKQSDEQCSLFTPWVTPGDYLVEAIALGGSETGEHEFEMQGPVRETITRSVTPTPTSSATESPAQRSRPSPSGPRPSSSP
jgi:hypothetical protein